MIETIATPFDDPIAETPPPIKKVKLKTKGKESGKGIPPQYPSIPKGEKFSPLPNLPKSPKVKAEFIFNYWKNLSPDDQARCTMYVYRKWPVIDRTKSGGPDAEKNIGKYHEPMDIEEIERIHGSGDYHVILNEQYLYKRTVLYTSPLPYSIRKEDSPPILDLRELDMSDPQNASYIERLRLKGVKFPGEEDKDMAAGNAAMETMAQTIKDLSTQAVTAAQRPPQVTAIPIRTDTAEQAAQKGANEMLVETCKTAIAIVKESAHTNQNSADPMAMVEAVTKIAERIAPKQDNSGASLVKEVLESNRAMNERISDMQNKQIDDLRTELRASRRESEAAVIPPKTLAEQLDELEKFSSTIKKISGIGGDEEGGSGRNGKTTWMDMMPVLVPAGVALFGQVASMIHNYAVAKGAPGQAMAPPAIPLTPDQQEMAQQAGMLQQIPSAPQQPQQQQPQGTMNVNPLYAMFVKQHPMLESLRKPLLEFMADPSLEYPGAEFAGFFIQLRGRLDYETLCGVGPDMIAKLLASYPPIWNEIQGIPLKVEKFILDFCNFDAIRESQDAAADAEVVPEGPRRVKL